MTYEGQIAETITSLLTQTRPPDRVVVVADNCTDETADIARRLGVEVPWEVSLVSTVDSARCGLVTPSITALSRDCEAYGAAAGALLLHILDGHPTTSRQVPTPVLRLRGSTGPAAR